MVYQLLTLFSRHETCFEGLCADPKDNMSLTDENTGVSYSVEIKFKLIQCISGSCPYIITLL